MSYDAGMRVFLTYVLLGMPALGVASYFRVKSGRPLPPKLRRYRAVIVLQVFLTALTILVANNNSIQIFGRAGPSAWVWVVAAGYMVLIVFSLRRGFRKLTAPRKQRARILLPEDHVQFRFWIVISGLAGLSEECAYRGLAYIAVSQETGSRTLAVVVCTAAFGIAHMLQGWKGVLGTSLIALVFHGLVFFTGGLYMPIVIHIVYDLIVGYVSMRTLMQETNGLAEPARAGS